MTQLRKCKCGISNYFDRVLDGIGHRGSSFSDIDAVTHDGKTNRFLLQEFKQEDEPLEAGQHWMLKALAALPKHFTVWTITKRRDGLIGFTEFNGTQQVISVHEYQQRFGRWWRSEPIVVVAGEQPAISPPQSASATPNDERFRWPTVDDIRWGFGAPVRREPGQEG